jgi:two-component system response regulator WspF
MRIGIVNDLRLAIESLKRAVATLPGATVAWVAMDGAEAVAQCARDLPDVVLMDMIMPVMDGVEATRRIMHATPCPIIVVTATVEGNAARVFEALGAGALDAVATPGLTPDGGVVNAEPLVRKLKAITFLKGIGTPATPKSAPATPPAAWTHTSGIAPCVAIGASTGGPEALATVLRAIPRPAPWPIIIVQHIDESFAVGLSEWLSRETGHRVAPAAAETAPTAGSVLVASSADHLVLSSSGRLRYSPEPRELLYRPSVDVFFESLVAAKAGPGVAVLLTGMGRDGAAGLGSLRGGGWITIAQDRATSVVWGMPGAAVQIDAASEVLPIEAIGGTIVAKMGLQVASFGRTP